MKVNQDQLIAAFSKYFENEIIDKAPTGLEKFKMGFVYGGLKNKLPKLIASLKDNPLISVIDIFDENGFIDVDEMLKYARESFNRTGKITVANIMFSENDLDSIYKYLKEV